MDNVKKIIKAIDDQLIESGKEYLLLGQANQLLVNKKIFTVSDQSNKVLKKILEKNKIPHAYQTDNSPRQWRIPLSKEAEEEVEKVIITTSKSNSINKNLNGIGIKGICPKCGKESFYGAHCKGCGSYMAIPEDLSNIDIVNKKLIRKIASKKIIQNIFLFFCAVIVILLIIGGLMSSHNNSKSNSNSNSNVGNNVENDSENSLSLYYINTTTYATTSEESFNEMIRYINNGDDQALKTLLIYGKMITLSSGTEVFLVDASFTHSEIRIKGSTQSLWINNEFITKK
jgi:hypothetical protein